MSIYTDFCFCFPYHISCNMFLFRSATSKSTPLTLTLTLVCCHHLFFYSILISRFRDSVTRNIRVSCIRNLVLAVYKSFLLKKVNRIPQLKLFDIVIVILIYLCIDLILSITMYYEMFNCPDRRGIYGNAFY